MILPADVLGNGTVVGPRVDVSRETVSSFGTCVASTEQADVRCRPGAIVLVGPDRYVGLAAQTAAQFDECARLNVELEQWDWATLQDAQPGARKARPGFTGLAALAASPPSSRLPWCGGSGA